MSYGRMVVFSLVAILLILETSTALLTFCSSPNYFFFEYGSSGCPHCVPQHEFFLKSYGVKHHFFCDIATNKTCLLYFVKYLNRTGLPPYVPQTLVFVNGRLVAVVIGELEEKPFWDSLISSSPGKAIPVYFEDTPKKYLNISLAEMPGFINDVIPSPISERFLRELQSSQSISARKASESTSSTLTFKEALFALVPLALADSVNPCTFTLYAAVLASASISAGRRKALRVGLAFIGSVFLSYLLLGFLLSEGASLLPKALLGIIASTYGAGVVLYAWLRGGSEEVCVEGSSCKAFRVAGRLRASVSEFGSAVLGAVASFTLLPCSGGPYLAFAAVISSAEVAERVALLAVYDLIFVSPLGVILAGVVGVSRVRNFQELLTKHRRALMSVAGVTLIIIGVYVYLLG